MNLDAFAIERQEVTLGGKQYMIPAGVESMTLAAVVRGKRASKAIGKLADQDCDLSDDEVKEIVDFIALATGIDVEQVAAQPLRALTSLIGILFKTDKAINA